MVTFACHGCGRTLSVPDTAIGKKARCPACSATSCVSPPSGENLTVAPDPDATVPPASGGPSSSTWACPAGYELLEELGRGGMGVVYRARQVKANREVALKMILAGAHADDADRDRFRTEVQAVARLQHSHIVQVFEVGEHNGQPFFSLEYCPGGSLESKLSGSPLAPRQAAVLVQKLAGAVQAAHDANVIHRDLKPANVLLAADGSPKVTDFGLAKKLDADGGQTRTGAVMGTPSYMAPEQASGKKDVGPAADIYALGAVLYECLTGRPPFKAQTAFDTILQVLSDEPVPPSRLNSRVPRDLETITLKCLSKAPTDRYKAARDVGDDLGRWLTGEPILARRAGPLRQAVRWLGRRRVTMSLVVAAVFVALAGASVGLFWLQAKRGKENARRTIEANITAKEEAEAESVLRVLIRDEEERGEDKQEALLRLALMSNGTRDRFAQRAFQSPEVTRQLSTDAALSIQAAVGLNKQRKSLVEKLLKRMIAAHDILPEDRAHVGILGIALETEDPAFWQALLGGVSSMPVREGDHNGAQLGLANRLHLTLQGMSPDRSARQWLLALERAKHPFAFTILINYQRFDLGYVDQIQALPSDQVARAVRALLHAVGTPRENELVDMNLSVDGLPPGIRRGRPFPNRQTLGGDAGFDGLPWKSIRYGLEQLCKRVPARDAEQVVTDLTRAIRTSQWWARATLQTCLTRVLRGRDQRLLQPPIFERDKRQTTACLEDYERNCTPENAARLVDGLFAGGHLLSPPDATRAARALMVAFRKHSRSVNHGQLASGLEKVFSRIPLPQRDLLAEEASWILFEALAVAKSENNQNQITRVLRAIGCRPPPGQALRAVQALLPTLKYAGNWFVGDPAWCLSVLWKHVPPAQARSHGDRVAKEVLSILLKKTGQGPGSQVLLVKALNSVIVGLPPERTESYAREGLKALIDGINRPLVDNIHWTMGEEVGLVQELCAKLSPEVFRVQVEQLSRELRQRSRQPTAVFLALMIKRLGAGEARAHADLIVHELADPWSRVKPNFRKGQAALGSEFFSSELFSLAGRQALVDYLKSPVCRGDQRQLILGELGRRADRTFASVWDFVDWAEQHAPDIDLLSPLRQMRPLTPIKQR